jgi:hypothetical protein
VRRLLYILFVLLVLSACAEKYSSEEQAAKAAQSYYQLLLDGQTSEFLQGKIGTDSLPEGYRLQLQQMYEQYVSELRTKHDGVSQVCISENVARRDSMLQLTYAFLMLCFGDSTQEEVTVPMVEQNGVWKMK